MIYKMTLADSVDSMTFDLLEVPIVDKDVEGAVDNTLVNGNVFTDFLWLKKQWTQKWALMCPDEYDRLRGFYTRQWDNAEVPTYRLFYGNDITEDVMRSGSYIIENIDAPLGAKMSLTQLDGNATQTTYSGKNLCSGTEIPNSSFVYFYFQKSAITAGAYRLSVILNDATSYNGVALMLDGTAVSISATMTGSANQRAVSGFTLSDTVVQDIQNATTAFIRLYKSGGNFTSATDAQLEKGSTVTDYEPYVGGTASPNPDYPQDIQVVTGENTVEIVPEQTNLANPQKFIDWVKQTNGLCSQYGWGTGSTRPKFGAWRGREHVISWNAATLYDKRDQMTNPTYDEYRTIIINEGQFKANTQYTISGDFEQSYAGANVAFNMGVRYTDNSFGYITISTANDWVSTKYTTASGKTIKSIQFLVSGGTSYIDLDTLQIEEGTQATTYTPFVSQSHEINLGKNLLSQSLFQTLTSNGITTTLNPDGSITLSGTSTTTWANIMSVTNYDLPAGVYTFSDGLTETERQGWITLTPTLADGTNNDGMVLRSGSNTTTNGTKKYTSPIKKLRMVIESMAVGTEVNMTIKPQLERGYLPTDFAPYFTPLELAKIGTYQDKIIKTDGTWYIHKEVGKVVLDGTEDGWFWTAAQTRIATLKTNIGDMVQPATGDTVIQAISTHFTAKTEGQFFAAGADGVMCITSGGYFNLRDASWTDLASAKSWLASNTPTVYYALATATDTEITNSALLEQLDTISELYGGVNNISLVPSAGAQGTMTVKIHKIYEQETDITPTTPIRLTLTDDGIINPCGCRKNIQLKMRETAQ